MQLGWIGGAITDMFSRGSGVIGGNRVGRVVVGARVDVVASRQQSAPDHVIGRGHFGRVAG